MKPKIIVRIAALCGALLSAAICSAAYMQPAWLNGGKFYLGAVLGVDAQHFNYRQNFTNTVEYRRTVYESGDVPAYSGSGGLLFGYQKLYQRFGWGVEGRGIYNANSNDSWDNEGGFSGAFNTRSNFKIPYQFDLLFKPILIVGHNSFVYLPIGVAYARLDNSIRLFTETEHALITEIKQQKFLWGFATGLGCEREITNKCNIFAEYNAYLFDSSKIIRRVIYTTPAINGDFVFRSKQFINAFRAGIRFFVG